MEVVGVLCGEMLNPNSINCSNEIQTTEIFNISLCAADAYYEENEARRIVRGLPVERAILEAADKLKLTSDTHSFYATRVDHFSFDSENRFAAGLTERGNRYRLCLNGAPEYLLSRATKLLTQNGIQTLTKDTAQIIENNISEQTQIGRRLVAVAYKEVNYESIPATDNPDTLLDDIIFAGVLVIADPVRPDVASAVRDIKSAGAKILLITGDNAQTALSVAHQAGIAEENEIALTGSEMEHLSDEDLLAVFDKVHVFARVLPNKN